MNDRMHASKSCIKFGKGCFQSIIERSYFILNWNKVDLKLALKSIVLPPLLDVILKVWRMEYIAGYASNMKNVVFN